MLAGKWGVHGARRAWPGHAPVPRPGRIPVVSLRAFIACTLLCRACCLQCIFRQRFLTKLLLPIYKCKSCLVSEFMFTSGILCWDVHVVAQRLSFPAELGEEAVRLPALSWRTGGLVLPHRCQPKHPGVRSCSLPRFICPDGKYCRAVAGFQTTRDLIPCAQCHSYLRVAYMEYFTRFHVFLPHCLYCLCYLLDK